MTDGKSFWETAAELKAKRIAIDEQLRGVGAPEPPEPILQFFAYRHLPPHLATISKAYSDMAEAIVEVLPRNAERTVALRKLLESKDAAVRARLAT